MFDAVQLHRASRLLHLRGVPVVPKVIRKLIQYLHGSYLPPEADLGEGTELGYGGLGVVIHPEARVGRSCFLSPQVTLGGRSQKAGAPILEDGVIVGSGAKILGPVRIGAGARVGANAVVIHDVPAGATVAGVPARIIGRGSENAAEAG
ncbi:MAG: serine acetyltransferase [Deltaproteobacteria bacterium]|nr:serine acetyltransferase [Deltaproteobacteria bacterium]